MQFFGILTANFGNINAIIGVYYSKSCFMKLAIESLVFGT